MKKLIKTLFFIALPFLVLPYIMSSCKKDPCAGITCQNGGTCLNGLCSCPTGYEGPACEKEKVPRSATIRGMVIKTYPALTRSGTAWDAFSGPDLFVIFYQNGKKLYESNLTIDHNHNALPTFVTFPSVLTFTDVTTPLDVFLYDYDDFAANEYMDSFQIPVYPKGEKFPEKKSYDCGKTTCLSFELTYAYQF